MQFHRMAQRRGSWLGRLWLIIPAFTIMGVALFIRSRGIISFGHMQMQYPAYVLIGLVGWQVFSESINAPVQFLRNNRAMISHSDTPHEVLIVASFFETLLNAEIRLLACIPVLILVGIGPQCDWLFIPFLLMLCIVLGLGIGLWIAPACLVFDDLLRLVNIALAFAIFATPVFYLISDSFLSYFNPMASILMMMRDSALGSFTATSAFTSHVMPIQYVAMLSLGMLVSGWLFYRLMRPIFVEHLV